MFDLFFDHVILFLDLHKNCCICIIWNAKVLFDSSDSSPKNEYFHYLLTLMSFRTCMNLFLLLNIKYI